MIASLGVDVSHLLAAVGAVVPKDAPIHYLMVVFVFLDAIEVVELVDPLPLTAQVARNA